MVDKENAVALDYIISKKKAKHGEHPRSDAVETYRNVLTVQLKNAVMHHIVKYREFRRVPKLKDILMMAIEKKKKEMQAARKKQQNMLLDQIGASESQLSDEQYELIQEQIEKINKTLEDHTTLVDAL